MPYYVRLMRKEDVPQASAIDREAFSTMWPPTNFQRELQNWLAHYYVACEGAPVFEVKPETPEMKRGFIERLKALFHADGKQRREPPAVTETIVGFTGFWLMADEAHITSIAVGSQWQGRGIGELLLLATVEQAAKLKATVATLEVRVSNKNAQKLYLKYGFAEMGIRKAYYTDNREDAVIMTTALLASDDYRALLKKLKEEYARKRGVELGRLIPA